MLSNFDCENDNSAFNLKPDYFLSLRHYAVAGGRRRLPHDGGGAEEEEEVQA